MVFAFAGDSTITRQGIVCSVSPAKWNGEDGFAARASVRVPLRRKERTVFMRWKMTA